MLKQKLKTILIVSFALLFMGGFSVFATWPDAPAGASNIAGWLGEVFNLNETGSGKLALNSKKIVLPTDASPISENLQVPTKAYVDSRVVASGDASSSIAASGALFYMYNPTYNNGSQNVFKTANELCSENNANGLGVALGAASHTPYVQYGPDYRMVYNGSYAGIYALCSYNPPKSKITSGKKIFVTSVGYIGSLGGESGADDKCQIRATAGGLSGTYKAW